MTRERIKDFREIVLPFFANYFLKENYENLGKSDAEEFEKDFKEIIELADKALEQQPCEDTISRADAVRVASGYCHPVNVSKELAKLPPVTPIRPKGHWIEEKIGGHEVNVCSHCQHIQHKEPTWHYCPLCGADMREVEESEE